MKFSCARENLEHALTAAERFTGKNVTLPILGNILFEVSGKTLTVTATNLEYAIQVKVQGADATEGKVCVPGKIVSSAIQTVQSDKLDLEAKHGNLFIKSSGQEVRINGIAADDFPLIPRIKTIFSFSIGVEELVRGLEQVLPAVAISEFKPELTGVLFKKNQATLVLVATDTFRLGEKTIETEKKEGGDSFFFILPHRVAQELTRIFRPENAVKVSFGENQVLFENDGIRIVSRIIEGSFPEYTNVIPKKFKTASTVERTDITAAVRSSSIFSSKLQDVALKFKEKSVELSAANADVGEYKTTVAAATSGDQVAVNFNHRYLLDGLGALDGEKIYFGLTSESSPVLMRTTADDSFLYVLMPIRLN